MTTTNEFPIPVSVDSYVEPIPGTAAEATCPGCDSPYNLHRRGCTVEAGTFEGRINLLDQLGQPTYLTLPPGLALETWAAVGATLTRVERAVQWWLGDWWRYGEHHYGEAASQAAPTGFSADTCRKAAWVADRIEPARRRTDVPWSHHDAVASLEPDDQDKLLARAATEGMNLHHVRAAARQVRGTEGPEPEPMPHVHRCIECGEEWSPGSPESG
jgi:hypothetical protein